MRECKRCGGSALRDYAYGCDHVFDDTPSPLVEVGVREGWREAWRHKAHEDALHREAERVREITTVEGFMDAVRSRLAPSPPTLISNPPRPEWALAPGGYTLRVDGEWRDVTVLPPAPMDGVEAEHVAFKCWHCATTWSLPTSECALHFTKYDAWLMSACPACQQSADARHPLADEAWRLHSLACGWTLTGFIGTRDPRALRAGDDLTTFARRFAGGLVDETW